jgi:predicted GNAT family N-acyltransferase
MTDDEIRRIPGDATLADAHAVRRVVFIEEQDVDEDIEMDGKDNDAVHYVVYDGDTPVGTARLRITDGVGKPERVAVRKSHRGECLGSALMEHIEAEAREQGCSLLRLHAQTAVRPFYREHGYEQTSEEFLEADIPHVEMEKHLQ